MRRPPLSGGGLFAFQFAREHHSKDLWDALTPVGEWMLENVW